MSLRNFCQRLVVTISPQRNIAEACRLLEEYNVGCMIVEEDRRLCGILTDRDIALKVTGKGKDPVQTTVREVMSPDPVCISVDRSLHELTSFMHNHHVRRVPIVDSGDEVLGIVTLDDVISLIGDEMADIGGTVSEAFFMGTA